jgi:hypothetical protein
MTDGYPSRGQAVTFLLGWEHTIVIDIVAGNDGKIGGLPAFRVQGSEGQHGLSEQQQPED